MDGSPNERKDIIFRDDLLRNIGAFLSIRDVSRARAVSRDFNMTRDYLYLDRSTEHEIIPLLEDEKFNQDIVVDEDYLLDVNSSLLFSTPISERAVYAIISNARLSDEEIKSALVELCFRNEYPHLLAHLGRLTFWNFAEVEPLHNYPVELYIEALQHSNIPPENLYNFIVDAIVGHSPQLFYYILSRPGFDYSMIDLAVEEMGEFMEDDLEVINDDVISSIMLYGSRLEDIEDLDARGGYNL